MVQAFQTEDGSLPQGLTIQNMYTELRWGSKKAVIVVRKGMAYSQTLQKKTPVARVVVVLSVPKPPMRIQLQEGGDEPQSPNAPRLTVRQRHCKLFDELDLSGLDSCPPKLADATHQLLAKYHNVFLLHSTPKGENEDLLLFVVPKVHRTTTLNGCHWDAGHQGCDHTLSLLQEHFW